MEHKNLRIVWVVKNLKLTQFHILPGAGTPSSTPLKETLGLEFPVPLGCLGVSLESPSCQMGMEMETLEEEFALMFYPKL